MIFFIITLIGAASATDSSRSRALYRDACELALEVPKGLRIVTGALLSESANEHDFAYGIARLHRKIRTNRVLDRKFAAYLYRLLSNDLPAGLGEDLFFAYLCRPGNQGLAADFAAEVIELVKLDLLYGGVSDDVLTARIQFVIDLLRTDPGRLGPLWGEAIDGFIASQDSQFDRAVANLTPPYGGRNPHPDAIALLDELARPISRTFAELELRRVPVFATILRLDRWVRSEAELTGPDYIDTIREHIFEMSRTCTTH